MKKPKLDLPEERQPRNIQRADVAPSDGFSLVVDGHFKTHYADEASALKAGTALAAKYPMLQIQIYDAKSKTRSSLM
jgi:hypothetical protein